jgi:hypothetical protein
MALRASNLGFSPQPTFAQRIGALAQSGGFPADRVRRALPECHRPLERVIQSGVE